MSLKFQIKFIMNLGSTGLFLCFTEIELRQKADDRTAKCDLLSVIQEVGC